MSQKILASISYGVGRGFAQPEEIMIDDPIKGEVLVKVVASGLCHSDLHLVEEPQPTFNFPAVLGHEVAGIVEAVGPQVVGINVGDRVVATLEQICGHCKNCMAGNPQSCIHPEECVRSADEPPRLSTLDGQPIIQAFGIGGFASKALIHQNQLALINDRVDMAQAACIGCATITGLGAAVNTAQVRPGDTVAVVGTGGVGLNVISGARLAGAKTIIAIDLFDSKLEFARKFGATHVVNSRDQDPVAEVQRITSGGVDKSFEAIGLAATMKQCWDMLGQMGTAYFIGLSKAGTTLTIDVDPLHLLVWQRGLHGVMMGSANPKKDIPLCADLAADGRLNLHDIVSQTISLDGIEQAYQQLVEGTVVRSVITSF